MNGNRWKSLSFNVSEKKDCLVVCLQVGEEEVGGWNICVRLHSRSIFMMPLRAVESVSLSSVTVGHCVGWTLARLFSIAVFLWGCSALLVDGQMQPCCMSDWDAALCLNLLAGNFSSGVGLFCLVSGTGCPLHWGQRAQNYLHSHFDPQFRAFLLTNYLFFRDLKSQPYLACDHGSK